MAYRTPSSVRTHVSVPTSDDLRVKDVRELRVDAQRLLDSREREEPEGLASPSRHDEARSPVEAFFDDEARSWRDGAVVVRRGRLVVEKGLDGASSFLVMT